MTSQTNIWKRKWEAGNTSGPLVFTYRGAQPQGWMCPQAQGTVTRCSGVPPSARRSSSEFTAFVVMFGFLAFTVAFPDLLLSLAPRAPGASSSCVFLCGSWFVNSGLNWIFVYFLSYQIIVLNSGQIITLLSMVFRTQLYTFVRIGSFKQSI